MNSELSDAYLAAQQLMAQLRAALAKHAPDGLRNADIGRFLGKYNGMSSAKTTYLEPY